MKVVNNYEINRLQAIFEGKPKQSVINSLKSRCFKWSPFYKAWQRQLTNNTIYDLKNILDNMEQN